jgi:heat shock protein HtpX
MDRSVLSNHKWSNRFHTLLLLGGSALLVGLSTEMVLGDGVWPLTVLGVLLLSLLMLNIDVRWVLKMHGASRLYPTQTPQIHALLNQLTHRAGLNRSPSLYWIPTNALNAFAVSGRKESAIVLTQGIINLLNQREMAGVLAHELSHIVNNDSWLLHLAGMASSITRTLALFGALIVLVSIPLLLMGEVIISPWWFMVLLTLPVVASLLQLALSRVREFEADRKAAALTGDPQGLASALQKIRDHQSPWWVSFFGRGRNHYQDEPGLFKTHPSTLERIRRLSELQYSFQPESALPRLSMREVSYVPYRSFQSRPIITRPMIRYRVTRPHLRSVDFQW